MYKQNQVTRHQMIYLFTKYIVIMDALIGTFGNTLTFIIYSFLSRGF